MKPPPSIEHRDPRWLPKVGDEVRGIFTMRVVGIGKRIRVLSEPYTDPWRFEISRGQWRTAARLGAVVAIEGVKLKKPITTPFVEPTHAVSGRRYDKRHRERRVGTRLS